MQVNEKILNSIKTVHKCAIIIIRTGTFCNVYGKDAYIISYLFGYKLRRIQNNILSTGFPKEVINKVMAKLEYKKIDYLVVNKKNNYEVEEKSINNNLNTYKKIIIDAKSYISAKTRVENINYIRALVVWLASPCVNCNSNNANFNVRYMNSGKINNNNLFNSNGNTNNNSNGVRAVASKKLWLHLLRWCKRRFRIRNKSMSFSRIAINKK